MAMILVGALLAMSVLYTSQGLPLVAGFFDRVAVVEAIGVIALWWPQRIPLEFRKKIFEGVTIVVAPALLLMLTTVSVYPDMFT